MWSVGGDPMLRDRYDPQNLFTQIPRLCLQFEPVLAQLDRLLEDDELFQQVKADLARRSPKTLTRGRPSTPVEGGVGHDHETELAARAAARKSVLPVLHQL